jgi:5-formyltetrahydrofolate cyclo-ligase
MAKAALRQRHLSRRKALSDAEERAAFSVITEKACARLAPYDSIGIYVSVGDEVDTHAIIRWALDQGKRVCVPKVVEGSLRFIEIHALEDCVPAKFGLLEPLSTSAASDPQIHVVPMLAFNQRRYRLGYGKGFYDAYLKHYSGKTLGLCYADDEEPELSEDPWDVPLDEILSER